MTYFINQTPELVAVAAVSPTLTPLDFDVYKSFNITLGAGNAVLDLVGNIQTGSTIDARVWIKQDSVGSRSISWKLNGADLPVLSTGGSPPVLVTTANSITGLHVIIRSTSLTIFYAGVNIS